MFTPISPLTADLYSLTMMAAYFEKEIDARASFELFVRELPPDRSYLVAAGLERALRYVLDLRFTADEIEYLRGLEQFRHVGAAFFEALHAFRFSGDVWAMPEGTPFFAMEPILRVSAPIGEAQLLEAALLNILGFETAIASKAARVVEAAAARPVVEFGGRHAHGPEAALYAARAAYLAGCAGTSHVLAGERFNIPVSGTMAHSFVMAYDDEAQSFGDFFDVFPAGSTILIDTYDTLRGLDRMIERGVRPAGVRIDSGDLVAQSRAVRARLDAAGMPEVRIFASGNLDERRLADLIRQNAPIDGFGVGTEISTSQDHPALGCVYKLVHIQDESGGRGRAKLTAGKLTYPYCKQVFRFHGEDGRLERDLIASVEEEYPAAETLLTRYIRNGARVKKLPSLDESRAASAVQRAALPEHLHLLPSQAKGEKGYPVVITRRLESLLAEIRDRHS